MRKSKILAKFRAGQPARLAMMGYFLPPFVAYAAHIGFDGIWMDTEHHNFDDREVQALLAFFHLYDIDCALRVSTREKARLYRYLEDGATGLIVPHVNDVQSVRDLVQSVKFPPIGDRGLHGRGLEANFGLDDRNGMIDNARNETFLIVQIETPQALAQAEEMASIAGVDGLYVGPADLGLRLSQQPASERITVEAAIEQVGSICKRHNKLWGSLPRTVDEVQRHAALGSNFLVWGGDARILHDGLTIASQVLEEAIK